MKVGIAVKFQNSPAAPVDFRQVYEDAVQYAREADALGFDYIVVPEHHSVQIGYDPTPFLALTALARETRQIGLTTQPLLLPLYHPVHVAEQLAVLDVISNGRAMLGVGVGYRDGDFEAFGVPRSERGARAEEALTILLGVLRQPNFSYSGRFYQARDVSLSPRPVQEPHPKIYVTARSRAAVARAVRFGLSVNTLHYEAIDGGVYAEYCRQIEAAGVNPSTVDVTVARNGYIARDMGTALRIGGEHYTNRNRNMTGTEYSGREAGAGTAPRPHREVPGPDGKVYLFSDDLVGTPETWLEAMQADLEALRGPVPFAGWTIGLYPGGMPLHDGLSALSLLAEQVLPWARRQEVAAVG
jgi:alkanesulfonate monooxygenase SsuD/methylene tetrahydromethanopterin reductase-like flavin-dependent oxidoreductase (luciferase family)